MSLHQKSQIRACLVAKSSTLSINSEATEKQQLWRRKTPEKEESLLELCTSKEDEVGVVPPIDQFPSAQHTFLENPEGWPVLLSEAGEQEIFDEFDESESSQSAL